MRTAPETDCEHAVYFGTAMVNYATMPMTVEVGGATIFVINVDHYERSDPGDFWETCLHLIQNNEKYEKNAKFR